MRIGIDLLFLVAGRGGGIERYARGLITGLQALEADHEYVLFTNRDCRGTFPLGAGFREVASNVSATFRPAKILWEQSVLPVQLAKHRIDVLLSPANISPLVHHCPSAVFIYDMIPFIRPEGFTTTELAVLKLLFRWSAKRNDKILTISESSKRDIVKIFGVPERKVAIIPVAYDDHFRPVTIDEQALASLREHGLPASYVLYVASSRKYKNVDGLLRAFKLLVQRNKVPHSLVITGLAGRAQPDLERLIDDLGLRDRVVFSGFVDDQMLPLLYSAAAALVYPSFYEGFGLPVIEAMACGTPVAAANRTSLPEAVGDAGLLFDPDSPEDMARVIHLLLTGTALRADLRARGLARAKTFSWQTTARRTLEALTELGR